MRISLRRCPPTSALFVDYLENWVTRSGVSIPSPIRWNPSNALRESGSRWTLRIGDVFATSSPSSKRSWGGQSAWCRQACIGRCGRRHGTAARSVYRSSVLHLQGNFGNQDCGQPGTGWNQSRACILGCGRRSRFRGNLIHMGIKPQFGTLPAGASISLRVNLYPLAGLSSRRMSVPLSLNACRICRSRSSFTELQAYP